ncbi:pyridoxal phosphate-dependent transferase [Mariannaea sp. PMI_226]|nr:pyridoxal phosphate-dependent transferase [Mariannaea sp. PMI_226]
MADPFVVNSNILHRSFAARPERVVSASGVSLILESGKVVLDATAGPAVSCIGQGRPEVAEAIAQQVNKIAYLYSGARFTCDAAEDLASLILKDRPGGLSKAIFVNSGSEATDAAIKLATQYWSEKGQPQKKYFIARKQSYHGNTIGALCVSGHDERRQIYSDWISNNVVFVDPCYSYRLQDSNESTEQYVQRLAKQLEDQILQLGPENVSTFVAETVSGTTLGCVAAVPGYFKAVRALCDKYDILLMLDEIMCGMGKTGTMHAWEQEGISGPDIQTIGKALGGGFVPLSGVLLHEKIFEALAAGSGGLMHGHTFQAHPTACAAAIEVQKIIQKENLLDNVKVMGEKLGSILEEELGSLPLVGNIRGRGLFWAVEFMKDKKAKTPFEQGAGFCNKVVNRSLDLGLNILGNLGKTGGVHVEHVLVCPPYIVTEAELRQMASLQAARDRDRPKASPSSTGRLGFYIEKLTFYPICGHCSRLNLVCQREAPRSVQTNNVVPPESGDIAPRSRDVSLHRSHQELMRHASIGQVALVGQPWVVGGADDGDLVSSRRAMLRYYTATLSIMLTTNLENNCFLSALGDDRFKQVSLKHRGVALGQLKTLLREQSLTAEMSLAITMVLCSMESIAEGTSSWYHHLTGAAAVLGWKPGATSAPAETTSSCLKSLEGRWLLRNFAYHDILMSVSMDRRPFLDGDYWLSGEDTAADPYFGFASRILQLIGQTSILNADFSAQHHQRAEKFDRGSVSQRARVIEEMIKSWTCPSLGSDDPLALLGEAYRTAALIHLYRTLFRHVPEFRDTLRQKISICVTVMCDLATRMPEGALAECTFLFPLFLAGGEAEKTEEIEIIRERLCLMNKWRRFRNVEACLEVLDEVWRLRLEGARRNDESAVDWLDVLRHRNWYLAIS